MGGRRVHQEACKRSHCQVLRPKPSSGSGGGKRGERKEWIHSVWDVLAFVALTVSLVRAGILVSFVPTLFPTPRIVLGT